MKTNYTLTEISMMYMYMAAFLKKSWERKVYAINNKIRSQANIILCLMMTLRKQRAINFEKEIAYFISLEWQIPRDWFCPLKVTLLQTSESYDALFLRHCLPTIHMHLSHRLKVMYGRMLKKDWSPVDGRAADHDESLLHVHTSSGGTITKTIPWDSSSERKKAKIKSAI